MPAITDLAKQYSKAGYSVIPVGVNKIPTIPKWREFQNKPMTEKEVDRHFRNAHGIALLCGGKHNLTAIDIDLKYDLSGDIFERYKKKIPVDILNKMYVQKTQSGGYHMVFSCEICENNQKLASRFTTADEKHQTYIDAFESPVTKDKAIKIASNDTTRVLYETRGNGGYILIAPSPGYEKVFGKIQEITPDEYNILMDTAREFNEVGRVSKPDSRQTNNNEDWELTPFQDYNSRGDALHLLSMNGWEAERQRGRNVRLKRPGKSSPSSALYDTDTQILSVFSTSTSFDTNRGYSNSDIFIHLECNDNIGEAYHKLVDMGFGLKKKIK